MQTYQNRINLNVSAKSNTTRSARISNSDNLSITKPMNRTSTLTEDTISPSEQLKITPTMSNEIGAPKTENSSTSNNAKSEVPMSKNEGGFMPNTPGNKIPGPSKNPAPKFKSETLNLNQETIISPEWRIMRT